MKITHPNYLSFVKPENDSSVLTSFIKELLDSDSWTYKTFGKNIIDSYNRNSLKLKIWQANADFKVPLYIVMVTGYNDNTMVNLGQKYGILRGFPILYIPKTRIKFFGFKIKFKNATKQEEIPKKFKGAAWFKKVSGFLAQLLCFDYEGKYFWTTCSKNSADSSNKFCNDSARLFEKYITIPLLNVMANRNIHICAEAMSKFDQNHGAQVYSEMPVITSMARGVFIDLKNKMVYDNPQKGYITNYGFKDIIEFCKTYCLKVGSAIICSNDACKYLFKTLHNICDYMDDEKYEHILETTSKKYPTEIKFIEGTMTHQECLGNVLEGLVIHSINTEEDMCHEEIVNVFENPSSNSIIDIQYDITKHKYPKYTVRTMCIRENEDTNIEDYDENIKKWAKHWCITPEGFEYWYNFAWAVKFMMVDNESTNPKTSDSQTEFNTNVGNHIVYSDIILEKGIPDDTNERISKILGSIVRLNEHITVVYPFCENDDLEYLRYNLENEKFHVLKGKTPPKHINGYISLSKIPVQYSKNSGKIFQIELSHEKIASLEPWQTKRLEETKHSGTIFAKDENHIIEKIVEYLKSNEDTKDESLNQEIRDTEDKLTSSLYSTISNLQQTINDYDSRNENAIFLMVGIQCIGKSTIFNEIIKTKKNIIQCSADIFMGDFDASRLVECHKLCQKAVVEAIKNGFHAFVDNTNILAEHRYIYKTLSSLLNVDLVVVNVCGDYWLNCSKDTQIKTLNALELRSKRREVKTGKVITRDVIERTMNNACNDFKKFSKISHEDASSQDIVSWLDHFPTPTYIKGLSYFNSNRFPNKKNKIGAFSYSSEKLLRFVESYLQKEEYKSIENINDAMIQYYTKRSFGNHITIIDPQEIHVLKGNGIKIPHIDSISLDEEFEIKGVGSIKQGSNSVFYLVVNWQWAQDFRKSLGLEHKDLHCTLGFSENDIFDSPKDISTLLFS